MKRIKIKLGNFIKKIHYRNYFLVFLIYAMLAHIIIYTNLANKLDNNFVFRIKLLSSVIMNAVSFFTIFFKGKEIAKSSKSSILLIVLFIFITFNIQIKFFIR